MIQKRAIVIRTMGDPEIAGAIVDGMSRRVIQLDEDELAVVKAELARLRARTSVRKYREDRDWHMVKAELAQKYAVRRHSAAYDRLLLAYVISYLFFKTAFKRLLSRFWEVRS